MLGPWHGATRRKHRKRIASHMIAKLFARLTADRPSGAALFDWATSSARRPDWYVEGSVPDTIDGRFAVLSSIVALCALRLEELGRGGDQLCVALTERFAQVMESEHRELGIGDPTLGKTVLKLVGSLARRVDALRPAFSGTEDWSEVAKLCFPKAASEGAVPWLADRLRDRAVRLRSASIEQLARGDIR